MRRIIATSIAAVVLALALAAPLATAKPGRTAGNQSKLVVSIDGPAKMKVARRLSFTYSCSIDCNVTVRSSLIMPGVVRSGQFSQPVAGGVVWNRYLTLPADVRRYLRKHLRRSKLRVRVSAVATEGSTVPVVSRQTFRFKK